MFESDFPLACNPAQRLQNEPAANGQRLPGELGGIEFDPRRGISGQIVVSRPRHLIQVLGVLPCQPGRPGNSRSRCGRIGAIQFRNDAVPDPVAGVLQVGVRFIFDPFRPPRHQELAQLAARHVQERPDQHPTSRVNTSEARQPRPSNQLEKKGLGLVVPGMADGNAIRPGIRRRTVKERISRSACGLFQ